MIENHPIRWKKEEEKWFSYKISSPQELKSKVDLYFGSLSKTWIPTLPELAEKLWVTTFTLRDYATSWEYKNIIDEAKQRIEAKIIKSALYENVNPSFAKFYLKNLNKYQDTSVIETKRTDTKNINIQIIEPKLDIIEWEEVI